ncbi:MAG: GDSL-type esterase/lipase family protein [Candidatus ainarchaeum sp.]|nr:GDSL-type esterase/lipase family protein [Candidatus ainarchaeum sp.]
MGFVLKNFFPLLIFLLLIFLFGCTQESFENVENEPEFLIGDEILEVIVLNDKNQPLENIEVDLWKKENFAGPPNAGYDFTNKNGKVTFNVPTGEYFIGFNSINFPNNLSQPEKFLVEVREGGINSQTISLYLKEELAEKKIVALGDSITKANNLSPNLVGDHEEYSFSTGNKIESLFVYLRSKGENILAFNLAESGATSENILEHQVKNVFEYNPKYITITVGGGDILENVSVQAFKSNMIGIINQIKNKENIVLIATLQNIHLMQTANFDSCKEDILKINIENITNEKIIEFNEAIKELAEEMDLILVDLYNVLGPEDVSDYDCLHLNINGQEKVAKEFINAINK